MPRIDFCQRCQSYHEVGARCSEDLSGNVARLDALLANPTSRFRIVPGGKTHEETKLNALKSTLRDIGWSEAQITNGMTGNLIR